MWKAELIFISELQQTIEEFLVDRLEGFVVSQLFCLEEVVSYSIHLLVSQSVNQPVSQCVCQQFSWPVCQPVCQPVSQSVPSADQSTSQSVFQQISQFSQLVSVCQFPRPPHPTPVTSCGSWWSCSVMVE